MKKHLGIFLRVVGYYALYIVLANIGVVLVLLLIHQFGIDNLPEITGEFISDVLLLPILVVIFSLYRKERKAQLFKKKLEWKKLLKLIPISIVARIAVVLVILALTVVLLLLLKKNITDLIDSGIDYQWSAFDQGKGIAKLFGFLSFAIFGPINEELLNRVVILDYLKKNYSTKIAIIYSSIIFMLAHLHPGLYISSLVLGLILAYVYVKWENLWYAILLHMLINMQPFILAYFLK